MTRVPSPTVPKMARTILKVWTVASQAERLAGLHWYDEARGFAAELAVEYGVTIDIAACVISAHSQNCRWPENKRRARAQLAGRPCGLGQAIFAAAAAMADPYDPFQWINGPKLNPFARCVAGDLSRVATDRWAQRIAYGLKGPWDDYRRSDRVKNANRRCDMLIGRKGARDDMIAAYEKAAAEAGVAPAVMQATVWIVIRGSAD